MAESMLVAFGRYLRTLRERRQLSLEDVATLTRLSPDPIQKGYLSRCENGHNRIGFSKMSTLCQVYEVPLDVVAERHSLDLELDRIGGPDTKGKSFEELVMSAAAAFKQGRRWDAYAQTRDALAVAPHAPLMRSFRDVTEQVDCIQMNVANVAASLGKSEFALYEFERLRKTGGLGSTYHPILLEFLAVRFLHQGDKQKARELSEQALSEAQRTESHPYLGSLYFNRALVASYDSEHAQSIELYQKAYQCFSDAGRKPECANTLMNIAQSYCDLRRFRSARRAIASAERLALSIDQHGVRARARILMGEIEDLEGKHDEAASRWHEAVDIAKELNDKVLHFKAEYKLFEQATRLGHSLLAAAFERRLLKLSNWVPVHLEELQVFRKTLADRDLASPKRVSTRQRTASSVSNARRSHPLM